MGVIGAVNNHQIPLVLRADDDEEDRDKEGG